MKERNIVKLILVTLLFTHSTGMLNAQKYFTRDGFISFYSSTPIEDIKANNSKVSVVLDSENGAIEFAALMKAFQFKKSLMEEHFNENYVESEKFPKAVFKGKIENIESIEFSKDGTYSVLVNGDLTIHGETQEVSAEGTIEIKDGAVIIISDFNLSPKDYKIEIPSVVRDNIAEEILISIEAKLEIFNR